MYMKDRFEVKIDQVMNQKKEMPSNVRHSIDQSYEIIRARSKKKKSIFIAKRVAVAACTLILTGIMLTNEHVMAGISSFFHFGDKGVDRAIMEGFGQESNSTATDQNIKITLEQQIADANKLGMNFELIFKDLSLLKNDVREISMDFRLKNGNGKYLFEFIPDTKILKGAPSTITSLEHKNPLIDKKTGNVQFDVLLNSNEGEIPHLKDAVVEVESVNIFYEDGNLKKIDGAWNLALLNNKKEKIDFIEYTMGNQSSAIQVSSAKASPTALNITFSVNGLYGKDENKFLNMKIIDEDGQEYLSDSFRIRESNKQTIISTNFPITSYNTSKKLKLVIEGFGEVELKKK